MNQSNLLEIASFTPSWLEFSGSRVGHLPFAAWVIKAVVPNIFVELGTHFGNSYFAFCQAVAEAGLSTKCFAVDTWQGEEHAGHYSEEIFAKVGVYNTSHYEKFSHLMQMTFDAAACYFSDGSVGLLHIDGLHTYEAVRHDFETWLPKLAPGAVVMLHDTMVRERGFGVWRFWEELRERYPNHIEFLHSYGLGVLQLNDAVADRRLPWLAADFSGKDHLVQYFADLGRRQSLQFEVNSINQELQDRDNRIKFLHETITVLTNQLEESRKAVHEFDSRINDMQDLIADKDMQINKCLNSRSWRLTEPLRMAGRLVRKGRTWWRAADQKRSSKKAPYTEEIFNPQNVSADDKDFDPEFYKKAYPYSHGLDPYYHYVNYGKNEGCFPCSKKLDELIELEKKIDKSKETVLIVSHEASRSGAPILSLNIAEEFSKKYNIILWLMDGGELLPDFQQWCKVVYTFNSSFTSYLFSYMLEKLMEVTEIKFAIVNSIVSSRVLPTFSQHYIPSVLLIHEFASYIRPETVFPEAMLWASEVVFSAEIVRDNALAEHPILKSRSMIVLPQGKCRVPQLIKNDEEVRAEKQRVQKLLRPQRFSDSAVVVLGAGSVQMRKGVDLFIACATRVVALCPDIEFHFVWLGDGFDPVNDTTYSVYLHDQIERSGIAHKLSFPGEVVDIEFAYQLSDIMVLSSRLDPLPNVAIDAMFKRLPVVCFERTTGIASILLDEGFGEACVAPYLDVEKAAVKVAALAINRELRQEVGNRLHVAAGKVFNMQHYTEKLETYAIKHIAGQQREKDDAAIINAQGGLVLEYFQPPYWGTSYSYQEAVCAFVRIWRCNVNLRKPFPGYHPGIYKELHGVAVDEKNPLADFLENDRPDGPWLTEVLTPVNSIQRSVSLGTAKVALHLHVYFIDLFSEIFNRLCQQKLSLDLLVSVPSPATKAEVQKLLKDYSNGMVDIRVVPNRGRDIGPLFTEFNATILDNYDIFGHVHTKKSGDIKDPLMGSIWFNFLLENLVGGKHPMATVILEKMIQEEKIGMVYPDDPYVVGWSANKHGAEELAGQLGIDHLPETHFNFPVGTMFWARTKALQPLFAKGFAWDEYPEEPVPYDGTLLHAIERLLPFVVKSMGYKELLTYIDGVTR